MRKQLVAVAILTAAVALTVATLAAIAVDAATPDNTTEALIELLDEDSVATTAIH